MNTKLSLAEQSAVRYCLEIQDTTLERLASAITKAREQPQPTDNVETKASSSEVSGKLDPIGRECPVCALILTADSFPQHSITNLCGHDPTFCNVCLKRCFEDFIKLHPWESTGCPECKSKLLEEDVKLFAFPNLTERYVAIVPIEND